MHDKSRKVLPKLDEGKFTPEWKIQLSLLLYFNMLIDKAKGNSVNDKVLSQIRGKSNKDIFSNNIRVLSRHKRRSWEEIHNHAAQYAEKLEAFLTSLLTDAQLETDDSRE